MVTHVVDDSHDGWRADQYLGELYRRYSRNQLQNLIADGRISMTGKRLKPSRVLHPGDKVHLSTLKSPAEEPDVDMNYKILFEDEHLLVVDKPGNLPVHPAGKFYFHTLQLALRQDRKEWCDQGNDFYLVHRLDRETSGIILLAKSSEAAGALWQQFSKRTAEKRYAAVVVGHCAEERFTVDADMGSDHTSDIRLKMAAFPKGTGEMEALTHFKVLRRGRGVDLVECDLKTGRQHQIRVHLAYAGHPIVGDKLYGGDETIFLRHISGQALTADDQASLTLNRHALHSKYLRFYHELADRWIEVESPIPHDLEALL